MSTDNTDKTTAALKQWRSQLATHRQPWPEWEALEALVNDGEFDLAEGEHVPFDVNYLASPADEKGYRVSHLILDKRQSQSLSKTIKAQPVIPNYIAPLLDLKWESSLVMSGGIASYLNAYGEDLVKPPAPVGPATLERETNLIQYLDPTAVTWPNEQTYCFQTNYSGSIFCLTSSGQIVSFSANAKRFVTFGLIDDFLRYCLMSVLQHRDWYLSYRDKFRIEEYNLTPSDDAGID